MAPRGGLAGFRLNAPQFRWSGEGLHEAPPELRREVEEMVRETILGEASKGLLQSAKGRKPLAGSAFEPFDADRIHAVLDLYDVPSYQKGGKKTSVAMAPKRGAKPPVELVELDVWDTSHAKLLDNTALYRKFLRQMLDDWSVPPTGVRGMLWREPDCWVLSVHDDTQFLGWVSWDHFTQRRVVNINGKLDFKPVRVVPMEGLATARLMPASEVREQMKNEIRAQLIEHQQKLGPVGAEFSQQLDEKVEAELKKSFTIQDLGAMVIEVAANGVSNWVYHPDGPQWSGIATLAPLTKLAKVPKLVPQPKKDEAEDEGFGRGEGAGKGDGGKKGTGKAGAGQGAGQDKGQGKPGGEGATDKEGKSPGALGGYGAPGGVPGNEELAKAFGFIYTGGEGKGEAGSLFPSSASGKTMDNCDEPFNGEPSLEQLGADGELLRQLIEEIAFKLQMKPCRYAARFALTACKVQAGRAVSVSEYGMADDHVGFVQPVDPKPGSVGTFEFIPAVSPAVQFMRHLAGVTPRLTLLTQLIHTIYSKPEHESLVLGDRYASYNGFFIDFGSTISGLKKRGAGAIFAMTCRVILMQLLRSSQKGIDDRLNNIDAYSRIFEELVQLALSDLGELASLRDELRRAVTLPGVGQELAKEFMTTWQDARKALVAAVEFRNPFTGMQLLPSDRIITAPDGTKGIRDSKGKVWTLDQLERVLAMKRDAVNQMDPLIPQITLNPEVLARFTANPQATRVELERLLREMKTKNSSIISENRSDSRYGFRASALNRDVRNATIPGTDFSLTGVHAMTHELIGEFFLGDFTYAMGVNSLLKAQEGWEDFKMLTEFVGVTLLAVFCAPLAFVVGGALAVYHLHEAHEKRTLFESLLDPELVITRAEVEAELFAAELGVLLSFIPDAGPILRGAGRIGKGVVRGEIRAATRAVARRLARTITLDILKALKGNLAASFARALLTAQVMNMFLGKLLIEPAVAQMQRDLASFEQISAMAARQ